MRQDPLTEALVKAIAHSDQPLTLTDPNLPDNPIVAMNPAFEAMTGYGPDQVLGRNCRFLQGRHTDRETAQRIGQTVREGHGCIEWIVNHKPAAPGREPGSGRAYWNLLFISPIRNADGGILYFLGNQLDITLGFPEWLGAVNFGRAHMTPEIEREFHTLLDAILVQPETDQAGLDGIIARTRRLAEVSVALAPGIARPVPTHVD